jgi:hypothetical protein
VADPPTKRKPRKLVERTAKLFWRAGEYPFSDAPPYTMSPEENRRAVETFGSAPIHSTHVGSPLDGKLGSVVRLFPATPDFAELGYKAMVPEWMDEEFTDEATGEKLPIPVSATWDRNAKQVKNVALVLDPRIQGAAMFSALPAEADLVKAEARFAAEGGYGQDPNNPTGQPQPAEGPDPSRQGRLVIEGDPDALATLRAIAERMGLVCEDETVPPEATPPPAPPPGPAEAPMSQTAAAPAPQPRPAAPATHQPPRPDPYAAKFAALERELKATREEVKALKATSQEAVFSSQKARLEAEAKALVRELARTGRILPHQRQAAFEDLMQDIEDDLNHPREVHFSAEDGTPKKGTRFEKSRARYLALPGNRLTEELTRDREEAEAEFSNNTGGPGAADQRQVEKMLAASTFAEQIKRERAAKNGKGA